MPDARNGSGRRSSLAACRSLIICCTSHSFICSRSSFATSAIIMCIGCSNLQASGIFRSLRRRDGGFSLPWVWLIWVLVVTALYPVCRWFANLKQRCMAQVSLSLCRTSFEQRSEISPGESSEMESGKTCGAGQRRPTEPNLHFFFFFPTLSQRSSRDSLVKSDALMSVLYLQLS
jgi:hypothetical protein